jgi:non-canonical poly(A) RNA polymerase PAPD5/7
MLSLTWIRLHKEIMDFYYRFKPASFENSIRIDLVDRLRTLVKQRWHSADIQPFGSFVAGLYLPTADMDLVFVSDTYLRGGRAVYGSKNMLFQFGEFLVRHRLPAEGTVEVIAKAKVPLVKYIDRRTGLRVDVSFENDTGIIANRTFKDWQAEYPAMPILVTLIKQFLAMRGLNEPVNGGIGGFSVTCLVTSLLQLMPQVQSGNMIPEHHLGEVLMEFLDLYGNEFNVTTTAIQFDPPGYVPKVCIFALYIQITANIVTDSSTKRDLQQRVQAKICNHRSEQS